MEYFTPNGLQMEYWNSIEGQIGIRGDKMEYLTVEGTKWNTVDLARSITFNYL
jgi:hypothetical protein